MARASRDARSARTRLTPTSAMNEATIKARKPSQNGSCSKSACDDAIEAKVEREVVDEHQAERAAAQRVDGVDTRRVAAASARGVAAASVPSRVRRTSRAEATRVAACGSSQRHAPVDAPAVAVRRADRRTAIRVSSACSARRGVTQQRERKTVLRPCSVHSPRSARSAAVVGERAGHRRRRRRSRVDRTSPRSSGRRVAEPRDARAAPGEARFAAVRAWRQIERRRLLALTSPSTDPPSPSPSTAAIDRGRKRDVGVVQRDAIRAERDRAARRVARRCPSAPARARRLAAAATKSTSHAIGIRAFAAATTPRPRQSVPSASARRTAPPVARARRESSSAAGASHAASTTAASATIASRTTARRPGSIVRRSSARERELGAHDAGLDARGDRRFHDAQAGVALQRFEQRRSARRSRPPRARCARGRRANRRSSRRREDSVARERDRGRRARRRRQPWRRARELAISFARSRALARARPHSPLAARRSAAASRVIGCQSIDPEQRSRDGDRTGPPRSGARPANCSPSSARTGRAAVALRRNASVRS